MASSASSSAPNLSAAQTETYAMLLNMGFNASESKSAASIFGSDVSAAVNYLTSQPILDPFSTFVQPKPQQQQQQQPPSHSNKQSKNNDNDKNKNQNQMNKQDIICIKKKKGLSLDDIVIEDFLDRIGSEMQRIIDEDKIAAAMKNMDINKTPKNKIKIKNQNQNNDNKYIPQTKEQRAFDEKTNNTIKNVKRLSLSSDQLQSQNMIGKAVWFGDVLSLREYPVSLLDCLDSHGNTALSLAIRLGHDNVSHSLLEMGADPMIELISGWNVIQEAVLHRDNRLVRDLLIHQIQLRGNKYESRNKYIINHLSKIQDFQLEIKWQITSTLAVLNSFIDKFAKIDNFRIWKSGSSIRFDMFMKGFSAQGVQKGHISFVFTSHNTLSIDHDRKTYTNAIRKYKNPDYDEMENEIRMLMKTDQGRASLRTSSVKFERKKGWMGGDKIEKIENYQCDVISTKGLSHSIIEDKRKGKDDNDPKYKWQHPSFDEYFDDNNNNNDNDDNKNKKGFNNFKNKLKKKKKFDKKYFPSYIHRKDQPVDVTLWLCQNYPLRDEDISIVLEAISIASEDMRKLADIFKLKFPGGFPIKLTMPIVVGISASATFCNYKQCNIDDAIFKVPNNYRMV